jgi:hypothetical protein
MAPPNSQRRVADESDLTQSFDSVLSLPLRLTDALLDILVILRAVQLGSRLSAMVTLEQKPN